MSRAVFLDRDGVLNEAIMRDGKPYPPSNVAELVIPPGTAETLAILKDLGFRLLVVTNQPDIARGTQGVEQLEEINSVLRKQLPLDGILVCPHDDADGCACRKPKPGLMLDAASRDGLRLAGCYLIGDRWRDVDAGRAAGCRTVWIDRGYRERGPTDAPDARVASLTEAVQWILDRERTD